MTAVPRLVAVSEAATARPDWPSWCAALAGAGVPALWVREKGQTDLERFRLAAAARRAFPPPRLLLVSGRADLALAAGADGVQLAADGLPLAAVRRAAAGALTLVGRSTHALAEIERAADEGVDFVLLGPVFATPGKVGPQPLLGVSSLAAAARLGVPVLAIGGVDSPARLAEVLVPAPTERRGFAASGTPAQRRSWWRGWRRRPGTATADDRPMTRILGLGLDLVDLDRMARLLERHGDAVARRICRDGEAALAAPDPVASLISPACSPPRRRR